MIEAEIPIELASFIDSLNEQLENAASTSTNRAFNLGCFVGLIPASIIVIGTFFLTNNSWVGAVVMVILMMIGLILFANLAAGISRHNSLIRIYRSQINPEIDKELNRFGIDRHAFELAAFKLLPPAAPLRGFLSPVSENTEQIQ